MISLTMKTIIIPKPTFNNVSSFKKDVFDGKRMIIVSDITEDAIPMYSLLAGKDGESIGYKEFFSMPNRFKADVLLFHISKKLESPKRQGWVRESVSIFRKNNPNSVILLCVDSPEKFPEVFEQITPDIIDAVDRRTESGEFRLIEKARRILELKGS